MIQPRFHFCFLGKSTLLAALAGTTRKGKNVFGSVWIDSKSGEKTPLTIS
jgi:ABC-type uncharacterized transport system YnjBCD ATPase subunit